MMKKFEWDENKRSLNLEKHGIDFIDAVLVFDDLNRVELESIRNDEHRFITIGQVEGVIILVVYTRRKEKKQLISARCASTEERKCYESNY